MKILKLVTYQGFGHLGGDIDEPLFTSEHLTDVCCKGCNDQAMYCDLEQGHLTKVCPSLGFVTEKY